MTMGNELLGDKLFCSLDALLRIISPYPDTLVIGSQLFDALASYMHAHSICGLTVDAGGQYETLYGMELQVDHALPFRLELVYQKKEQAFQPGKTVL